MDLKEFQTEWEIAMKRNPEYACVKLQDGSVIYANTYYYGNQFLKFWQESRDSQYKVIVGIIRLDIIEYVYNPRSE